MIKVIIVGAYPPPIGGNSVHIKRLKDELDSRSQECVVLDIYGSPKDGIDNGVIRIGPTGLRSVVSVILYLLKNRSQVVHFHVSALDKFIYLGMFMLLPVRLGTMTVITIHSGGFVESYSKYNYFKKILARKLLGSFGHVITVNQEQKSLLVDEGLNDNCVSVIPAYLPPIPEADVNLDKVLENLKSSGRKLLITSGYGWPLYGFEIIINAILTDELSDEVSLLICTYNAYDKDYMVGLEKIINHSPNIHIVRELSAEKFSYVLKNSDVYIRATDQDGDAVAIREADYFGLPVVASDVVKRPEYCHLFNLHDRAGLLKAINESTSKSVDLGEVGDVNAGNFEKILSVYEI